jgi:hypothetical protein
MGKPKVGSRPNEFKYGMALYGVAWPEGPYYFVCGGGGHGLQNRSVIMPCGLLQHQPCTQVPASLPCMCMALTSK